jgi:hypothetical protein
MSKKLPVKAEVNDFQGPVPKNEQTEADAAFDAALKQLSTVIGIDDVPFCTGLLEQIFWMFVGDDGKFARKQFGFVIACLYSDKPRNRDEAMGRVQKLASHLLSMKFAERLWFAKTLQEIDNAERTYNKLARTWLAQCQALDPDRGGGPSKVTVVTVSDRSQAIVGDVTQNTRGPTPDKPAPPAPEKPAPLIETTAQDKETLMPPANEGTVQSRTRVRRR